MLDRIKKGMGYVGLCAALSYMALGHVPANAQAGMQKTVRSYTNAVQANLRYAEERYTDALMSLDSKFKEVRKDNKLTVKEQEALLDEIGVTRWFYEQHLMALSQEEGKKSRENEQGMPKRYTKLEALIEENLYGFDARMPEEEAWLRKQGYKVDVQGQMSLVEAFLLLGIAGAASITYLAIRRELTNSSLRERDWDADKRREKKIPSRYIPPNRKY